MSTAAFFQKIRTYYDLSEEAELAWTKLLQSKTYKKGENFINEGNNPGKSFSWPKGFSLNAIPPKTRGPLSMPKRSTTAGCISIVLQIWTGHQWELIYMDQTQLPNF
jgi:hypothetical protein